MKLATLAVFSALLLFSTKSLANPKIYSGSWNGKGTYILNGDMTQCSQFNLVFAATENTFTFVSGRRSCEKHEEVFYKVSMAYRNGSLYYGNQVVGSYDGNVLHAAFSMPDGGSIRHWRMSMRREGDHLVYEESRTMQGETTPMISFAGLLIRQK